MPSIHKTAIIEDGATIKKGAKIDAYAFVSSKAVVEEGVHVMQGASVCNKTKVGQNTRIFPYAMVGTMPQDLKYQPIIFKGLFFIAEFNKNLNESSFVVPEKSHSNMLGKEKSKVNRFGELIKLENPEFEKIFSVYGTSEQEARYILTPMMMEAMVAVYKKFGFAMRFSFIGSKVYCAIPMKKDMFEPNIKRGVKCSDIEEFYMILNLIETIITEMNLNTRIWTKI